jgi:hypothetical protein
MRTQTAAGLNRFPFSFSVASFLEGKLKRYSEAPKPVWSDVGLPLQVSFHWYEMGSSYLVESTANPFLPIGSGIKLMAFNCS